MVNLIQNKLFNTCIHWSYDTAKKFRKKRTRIKGVSTSTKYRRICNCKAERPNQKWTWSANYRMDIWSPPRIKWRESVDNTPQNWFVRRRTFLELLCSSRGLKEPVRTIELCKNVITLFWWLSIRPCVLAVKSILCYGTLRISRFETEIFRHLWKILHLRQSDIFCCRSIFIKS